MKRFWKMVSVVGCCAMFAGSALAQMGDDKAKDSTQHDEMMQAWGDANKPGEHHQQMAKGVGEWACVVKHFNPDGTTTESKGWTSTTSMFEGRYIQSNFKGEMPGMEGHFKGQALMGYNNATGEYECTWVDSMSTGIMLMKGKYETSSRTMTLVGECMCPIEKKNKTMKEVTTWTDDDHYVSKFYDVGDEGKESPMMEISYTRAKGAGKDMDKATDEVKKKGQAEAEKKAKEAADKLKPATR